MRERLRFEHEIATLLRAPPRELEEEATPQKLTHLSLFRHCAEVGGRVDFLEPTTHDPGIYDGPDKYKRDPDLQQCVSNLKDQFKHMQVALVDLTGGTPRYAGFRDDDNVGIASMGKVSVMLAAHQLQFDLAQLLKVEGFTTAEQLFDHARKTWLETQIPESEATPFSGKMTLLGRLVLWKGAKIKLQAPSDLPNLKRIFELRAGTLVFTSDFREQLKKMVGDSDNSAAAFCARNIGFPFVASVLIQTGLWDPVRGGGLWERKLYGQEVYWNKSPLGANAHNATAGALAAFMTLVIQRKLVNPTGADAMRSLMDKDTPPGNATYSPFEDGIERLNPKTKTRQLNVVAISKLGLFGGKVHDCAYVEHDTLKYIAVGLSGTTDKQMAKLALALEDCIRKVNP